MLYAQVIVKSQVQETDRIFTYRVPDSLSGQLKVGMMVRVPFGAGNRTIDGFVLGLSPQSGYPESRIKSVERILGNTPVFASQQLKVARWMSEHYMASMSSCLSLFVPKDPERIDEIVRFAELLDMEGEAGKKLRGRAQIAFLELLQQRPQAPLSELMRESGITWDSLRSLEQKKYIRIFEKKIGEGVREFIVPQQHQRTLNEEQQQAFQTIDEAAQQGLSKTFLLYGITGSGKTEVYIRLIEQVLARGKGAYLLVPEISLTPQLEERLTENFGPQVAMLHSRQNDTERSRAWERIRRGEARVAIGPRSALFAPVIDPGLIILDEEHETSYKSEIQPRYHAREVAQYMAENGHFPVVLGSATPSVETYVRAMNKEYGLLRMKQRAVASAVLPKIQLIDMRQEMMVGNMSSISHALHEAIQTRLERREQTILLMNRKGYSSSVSCRSCGFVLRCPACFLPYTYHKDRGLLICHHCGKEVRTVAHCPSCASRFLQYSGSGTQKIEEEVQQEFPQARILRMDADTTSRKNAFSEVYQKIRDHEADIIVGTQMIAKGLDIPQVTLVGVLNADQTLFHPDYHSSERTYQLLTQVSGRAGRGDKAGMVCIQTFNPDHYVLRSTANNNDQYFYREEMLGRQMMKCPPYAALMQILVSDRSEEKTVKAAFSLKERLETQGDIEVLGPSPAELGRIDNVFRWKILVRCEEEEILISKVKQALSEFTKMNSGVLAIPDLNPMIML